MKNEELIYAKWLNGEISNDELSSAVDSDTLKELERVIRTADTLKMPKYNTAKGYDKFRQNNPSKNQVKKNWILGACIAVAFVVLLIWVFNSFSDKKEEQIAGNGENVYFAFNEGSEVWLNDGSTIKYQSENWDKDRVIDLTGEALFEVSKGTPFIVNTKNGRISVLGTKFNVRSWGEYLYVECYEGKVKVQSANQETVLIANEGVHVIEGDMNKNEKITHNSPFWKDGISRFFNEKLMTVCQELERQFNIKVELKVHNRNFSGNFSHSDLENALNSICKPLGLNYEISSDKKTVIIE